MKNSLLPLHVSLGLSPVHSLSVWLSYFHGKSLISSALRGYKPHEHNNSAGFVHLRFHIIAHSRCSMNVRSMNEWMSESCTHSESWACSSHLPFTTSTFDWCCPEGTHSSSYPLAGLMIVLLGSTVPGAPEPVAGGLQVCWAEGTCGGELQGCSRQCCCHFAEC